MGPLEVNYSSKTIRKSVAKEKSGHNFMSWNTREWVFVKISYLVKIFSKKLEFGFDVVTC